VKVPEVEIFAAMELTAILATVTQQEMVEVQVAIYLHTIPAVLGVAMIIVLIDRAKAIQGTVIQVMMVLVLEAHILMTLGGTVHLNPVVVVRMPQNVNLFPIDMTEG